MRASIGVALSVCLTVAALAAQSSSSDQNQPRPTFRGGVNYVRVDMYASTRDGQPITDLKAGEIELLEDGVPQRIENFEYVQVRTNTPQETRIEPNGVQESRDMAAGGRARVFVIFLDTYHTTIEGSANMRLPLIRFLDRVLGAEDLVAVMTPEMAASDITFGRKTTVISNIMQREWTWGRRNKIASLDPKEELYQACYPREEDRQIVQEMKGRRREKLSLDALEDLVVFLQGVRDERKAVLTVSEGWILYSPDPQLDAVRKGQGVPLPNPFGRLRGDPADRSRDTGNDLIECDADRLALAQQNDGLRVREITDAANRSNVTFYPVYPRGLTPFDSDIGPERPPSPQQDSANLRNRQQSLRSLAQDTDGTAVINTNNIEGALKRIVDDLSSYYLFGYNSTNTKLDGKFRSITVRVKRPGVQVRARRGYRALTPEEVMTRSDRGTPGAAAAATPSAVTVNPRAQFRIRSASWTSDVSGVPEGVVWLVGEMDFATRRDLAWSSGATAEISVVSGTGERVASMEVPFTASDGAFTLKLPEDSTLAPGDYAVRVRVTPQAGQALPLTDLARVVVPPTAMPLGEAVMLRRGGSTGPRFIATADPRFRRSDRLRLELPTRLDGMPAARLLDRAGTALPVPVTVADRRDESGSFRWVVAEAPLAPLAAGDYAVEVTLGTAKQVTPFRIVP